MEIPVQLDLKKLEYKLSRFEWAPVFTVSVIPSQLQDPERLMFDWEMISYTPRSMQIQLVFHTPLYISFEDEPDVLELNFGDPEIFTSSEGI